MTANSRRYKNKTVRKRKNKQTKNKHNKNIKKRIHNKKGGLWPFSKTKKDTSKKNVSVSKTELCPDINKKCDLFDTQLKNRVNQTWVTCINLNGKYNHILYLTPNNVIIKSIDSQQIPEFKAELGNGEETCKIMIEGRFVSCFLLICGEWYAIMRAEYSLSFRNFFSSKGLYYKLKNIKIDADINKQNSGTSLIKIDKKHYVEVKKNYVLTTSSNSKNIELVSDSFVSIYKASPILNLISNFWLQKKMANQAKQDLVKNATKDAFDFGLDNMNNIDMNSVNT